MNAYIAAFTYLCLVVSIGSRAGLTKSAELPCYLEDFFHIIKNALSVGLMER